MDCDMKNANVGIQLLRRWKRFGAYVNRFPQKVGEHLNFKLQSLGFNYKSSHLEMNEFNICIGRICSVICLLPNEGCLT